MNTTRQIDRSQCRSHPNPDLWHSTKPADTHTAITICMKCPVIRGCLRNALINNERYGTWGGLSETQRAAVHTVLTSRLGDRQMDGSAELEDTLNTFAAPPSTVSTDNAVEGRVHVA